MTDCNWLVEQYDDTLKQLFMADEALAHGDRTKAVAYLKSQADVRLPAMFIKAGEVGPVGIESDLRELAKEIQGGASYARVHEKVMHIDGKYALSGYKAFARCYYGYK